jgi:hypothetical protein
MSNIKLLQPLWSKEDYNSQSDEQSPIIVQATQPIGEGDELFLPFEQHLHSQLPAWFDQIIPTMEDYTEADLLIQEARTTFRGPLGSRARNTNKRDQASVVGLALRMIQKIVARYRPAAAKLLRVALESLSSYIGKADQVTSLSMGLKNHTFEKLKRHGLCISDVDNSDSDSATTTTSATTKNMVVTRNVTQGNRVYPVPLLVRLKDEGLAFPSSCSNVDGSEGACRSTVPNACWSRPEVSFEICPLLPLNNMNIAEPGAKDVTVELQWSHWIDAAKVADLEFPALVEKVGTKTDR